MKKNIKTIFIGGPMQHAIQKDGVFNGALKTPIERVITQLEKAGYNVLSAHRYEFWGELDVTGKQEQVCRRDFAWMKQCDLFIAVLPETPAGGASVRSDGTCVELGWAAAMGKKIIVIKPQEVFISHLVNGLGAVADVVNLDVAVLKREDFDIARTVKQLQKIDRPVAAAWRRNAGRNTKQGSGGSVPERILLQAGAPLPKSAGARNGQ